MLFVKTLLMLKLLLLRHPQHLQQPVLQQQQPLQHPLQRQQHPLLTQ
jgi:hypothetical protein